MVSDDFQEDNPKFSTRYFHQDPSVQDVLYEIMELAKVFLILPAVVATTLLISNLENFLPALNSGIIELLAVLVFIYFNTNYWILLAYLIQSFHDLCTEDQPVPKTFLSIIPQ